MTAPLGRASQSVREGVAIAFDALQTNKLRSTLTILGVVIGVATVMAMASIVEGLRSQILNTIEVAGPTTFYVMRFFSQTPLNPEALPREVRIRPVLRPAEAEAISRLPQVSYGRIWIQVFEKLEHEGIRTQLVTVFAADSRYMEIQGGTLLAGRFFTPAEERSGAAVSVLESNTARTLFGNDSPIGKLVRVGGRPFSVVGLYRTPDNIFQPPSQEIAAVIPFEAARRNFHYDETNALFIVVKPRIGITVAAAQDAVTITLRQLRGLRPADPNTFDLITQDQILDVFNKLTGVFFLVMLVLSSVALMVGGIGVIAIMTVSVTSRTREIGVRKALGATRQEILWQFLVEAATLTLTGGLIGIVVGLGTGEVLKRVLRFQSGIPLWSALVATAFSVGLGLAFGVLPASRAARLDPVEALRYE